MTFSRCTRRFGDRVSGCVEMLEPRCLFSAVALKAIPAQAITSSKWQRSVSQVILTIRRFPPATVVNLQTTASPNNNIPIELTNAATPNTVKNFLQYLSSGEFTNTIIHRSVPGFAIQGGGYTTNGVHIKTTTAIKSEASTEKFKNTVGTIAMALTGTPNKPAPDSATGEWFINLANNDGTTKDGPDLNDASDGGPFTCFGKVIYNGMNAVNAIAALPIVNDAGREFSLEHGPGAYGNQWCNCHLRAKLQSSDA